MVSLQTTMSTPSIFRFQIGSVQPFVGAARSTRDCWSGSYLIAWHMAHMVRALEHRFPGHITWFTPLRTDATQDLITWLGDRSSTSEEQALVPNIPNVLWARIASHFDSSVATEIIDEVFRGPNSEWRRIADTCWNRLGDNQLPKEVWDQQVARVWDLSWQIVPVESDEGAAKSQSTSLLGARRQSRLFEAANAIDTERQLRNDRVSTQEMPQRDAVTGIENAIITKRWIENLGEDGSHLRFFFRKGEPLSAISIIKRLWHRCYLVERQGFSRESFRIPSVPAIAVSDWKRAVVQSLHEEATKKVETDVRILADEANKFSDEDFPRQKDHESFADWVEHKLDGAVFTSSFWNQIKKDGVIVGLGEEALQSIHGEFGSPSSYFAVIAADGDGMGKIFDRANSSQDSASAINAIGDGLSKFACRELPDLTRQFSGYLVYAGGDDVLALVPARMAVDFAIEIQRVFSDTMEPALTFLPDARFTLSVGIGIGHHRAPLQDIIEEARTAESCAKAKHLPEDLRGGRIDIRILVRSGSLLTWHVGGDSGGTDLYQYLSGVFDASELESGEVSWCGKWRTRKPTKHQDAPPISRSFFYQVIHRLKDYPANAPLTPPLEEIVRAELRILIEDRDHVTASAPKSLRGELRTRCEAYLAEILDQATAAGTHSATGGGRLQDFISLFALESFLNRQ